MGLANWVVGRMVDAFLAQPPEEKAAVFETMATKFWDDATPEEIAKISELLLPRFMEHFLGSATTEQKAAMMQSLLGAADLEAATKEMLPGVVSGYLQAMSPGEWQAFLPTPASGMPGMPQMPGAGESPERPPGTSEPRPPKRPGGMMPW